MNTAIVPQLFTEVSMPHTAASQPTSPYFTHIAKELDAIRTAGLYKAERVITSAQSAHIRTRAADGSEREVLNLCANNYLGLSSHPKVCSSPKHN
mgnify:CR=1 FL=1